MSVIAGTPAYLAELTVEQLLQHELVLAANRLASKHIAESATAWPAICRECGAKHPRRAEIQHRADCLVGAVDRILIALRDKVTSSNPQRKETAAHKDTGAADREIRPLARPFLVGAQDPSAYGEPWVLGNNGCVYDRAGKTILDPQGCDLEEGEDVRAVNRAKLCVNFCAGVPDADLERVGGVQ